MTDQQGPTSPTFNEAPASWNVRYVVDGFECMLTLRANGGDELMPKTKTALAWLKEHGALPVGAKAQAPAPQSGTPPPTAKGTPPPPAAANGHGEETVVIKVESIAHAVTDTGHHHVKVKGGKFSKFGIKAWAEVIPANCAGWEAWPIGQEYQPMDGMEYAVIKDNKVAVFRAEQ
jgi:hypothetical protein